MDSPYKLLGYQLITLNTVNKGKGSSVFLAFPPPYEITHLNKIIRRKADIKFYNIWIRLTIRELIDQLFFQLFILKNFKSIEMLPNLYNKYLIPFS